MFEALRQSVKPGPEGIRRTIARLDIPLDRVRPRKLVREARARLARTRLELERVQDRGQLRLWRLGTDTLDRARQALDQAPEPLRPLAEPIRRVVDEGIERLTEVGVEDYDALNARRAAAAVREMNLVQLERVERYERAHKNRKTVLDAVARRRERLAR